MNDPTRRGKAAIIALGIWLIADFALALDALNVIAALDPQGRVSTEAELESVDAISRVAAIAFTLAYFICVVFVARWIMLVNANAQGWSSAMTITPGWNVGWFFVPVANLWKPFQGIRETWQASEDPDAPGAVAVPLFMRWWWGLWIVTNILGQISFRLSLRAETAEQLTTARWFDVAAIIVDLPLAALLVLLIKRLNAKQIERIDSGTDALQ